MSGSRGRRNHVLLKPLQAGKSWRSNRPWVLAMAAILCLCASNAAASAQAISRVPSINTIAGNGTPGYSGDGGPASSAELNSPSGLAVDGTGNLYIADPANNRIREVAAATGTISTFAGNGSTGYSGDGGPATGAELDLPVGVAADSAGNLYIADQGNNVIRKVSTNGTITTVAGNHTEGYSGDSGQATNATLYAPSGVAVDSAGNLYIADQGNNRIRMVSTAGTITTVAGNGTAGYGGDNGAATSATLNKPSAVAEDGGNNLYILDTGNNVVRKVTTGTITTIVGNGTPGYTGDGGPATSATLNTPHGLGIDASGNLYIADSKNNAMRMVNTAGVVTTVAGDGTAGYSGDGGLPTSATLNNPQAVVVDGQGNLYISDSTNNRIREVTTPGGSVLFPTVPVTSTSAAVTIPLQVNAPGTTITGITVPVSQGGKQEYEVTATGCTLNTALDAGAICNVMVTFTPGYPGMRPVPLRVATSAETFSFGMSGIGTAPQVALSPGILGPQVNPPIETDNYDLPGGAALDSAGNLYTVLTEETLDNSIIEYQAGTNVATTVLAANQILGDDFGGPLALAVDGAGNLFIANPALSCIFKVAPGSGRATVVAGIPGTCEAGYNGDNGLATNAKLNAPSGIAVDRGGNLYIADRLNYRIRKVSAAGGIITTVAGNGTPGYSGDNLPATSAQLDANAVAVDGPGNLYISSGDLIRKVSTATGIITTVAGNGTTGYSGDNGPATDAELNGTTAVAVDSAGDIYVEDSQNNIVRMVNPAGLIVSVPGTSVTFYTNEPELDPSLLANLRLALDSAGNLYISGIGGVNVINVSASALSFPTTPIGSPSAQSVTVTNTGNAPLTFTAPASGQNPSTTAGFAVASSGSCPQPASGSGSSTLASGASCTFAFDFVPGTSAVNGTASIMDNALNANPTQTVQLSGAAGDTVATTTTISVTTPVSGQTQVSAAILPTSGTAVPLGSVVFTVDGTVQPAVQVNFSGVATLPAAVSNRLAVGSHTINAAYTSSTLGFTNSVATLIFAVGPAPTPPSVAITPSASSLSVAPGSSVTDTLTITPVGGYAGTLQFSCSNLPQNASCSFQPSTVTLSGTNSPQTTILTIQTAGGTAALRQPMLFAPRSSTVELAAAFWAPGLLALVLAGGKRRTSSSQYYWLVMLALLGGTLVVSGCGGGSVPASTTPNTPPSTPATPAGTSTMQISASAAGNTVQSFALTLTVQ
jgi:trimeric autotransporter adhesin